MISLELPAISDPCALLKDAARAYETKCEAEISALKDENKKLEVFNATLAKERDGAFKARDVEAEKTRSHFPDWFWIVLGAAGGVAGGIYLARGHS